jgi:hypothetical protein
VDSEHNTTVTKDDDLINHPYHYTWHPSGVECKDIIQEFSYNIGSAMGYLWRHEYKNGVQDLKKAIQHIQFEIERLEKEKQQEVNYTNNSYSVKAGGISFVPAPEPFYKRVF